jgi:hypothetical protein
LLLDELLELDELCLVRGVLYVVDGVEVRVRVPLSAVVLFSPVRVGVALDAGVRLLSDVAERV